MGDRKTFLTSEIVKYSQKLDAKGYGANHDGNISAKLDDVLLATPTAVSKGSVVEDIIITLDMQGNKLAGHGKSFSEIKLHYAAYNARPDAKAVVHAHPPFATARGLIGANLIPNLPEAIVSIGDNIPVADFVMPGAPENTQIITDALMQVDVFMLQGNGVLAIGDNVEQAYLRVELVEHLAKIQFYAEQMGQPRQLRADEINALLEKRRAGGLGPQARGITNNINNSNRDASYDEMTDLITQEVLELIRK
ncbi:MAG: class II aldolase/adducin family protein [Gammaproteobacteria bacterium]|nr:class II aldolase/adducin family protein [Gammaproteobacteria bacterium]